MDDPILRGPDESAPRSAATLVLVRDSATGPEVLLAIRDERLRFMGGAAVFPGGAVEAADLDGRWEESSRLSAVEAERILGEEGPAALGFFVCALRETFEEVGLFLGDGPAPDRAIAADARRFLDVCRDSKVVLSTDRLIPAGRWVTPLGAPIRFDARFFVAVAPDDFSPVPDRSETADAYWVAPGGALAKLRSGELLMAPPTIEMLQRLDGHASCGEILATMSSAAQDGVERLSPFVQRIVAPNPGLMTGPGTNTYVVGAGPFVVVDPAVDDAGFIDAVLKAAPDVEQVLITHRHSDHVGGVDGIVARTGARVRAWGDAPAGTTAVAPLTDGESLEAGGATLEVIYTPGHASDHVAFFLAGAASLFAGDAILGQGTAVIAPPDGDMTAYLATLERLGQRHISRIFPGHFAPLDGGNAVIAHYIEHRAQRQAAILDALRSGAKTVESIVEAVYTDTPQALHPVARYSVLAVLEMLEKQGTVLRTDNNGAWAVVD